MATSEKNRFTDFAALPVLLENTLRKLTSFQLPTGEFETYEHYPTIQPGHWIKGPSSPFITACILIALADIEHPLAGSIKQKGCNFIEAVEEKGLWRFWKNNTSDNNVPCDADDTALCSFALKNIKNRPTNNAALFAANRNAQGLFYTWFLPRLSFVTHPARLVAMYHDSKAAAGTIQKGFLGKEDVEPAVVANALLYLGQNKETEAAIQYLKEALKNGASAYPMHFYSTDLIIWYHVARACHHSVSAFSDLKDTFSAYFAAKEKTIDAATDIGAAYALYNSACYFNLGHTAQNLLAQILNTTDIDTAQPFGYFTSKNRIYNAGATALTLSWHAETLQNAIKLYR